MSKKQPAKTYLLFFLDFEYYPYDLIEEYSNHIKSYRYFNKFSILKIGQEKLWDQLTRSEVYVENRFGINYPVDFNKDKNRLVYCNLNFGEYYPRIFRPLFNTEEIGDHLSFSIRRKLGIQEKKTYEKQTLDLFLTNYSTFISSQEQIIILIEKLKSIFRVVHPEAENMNTFGFEIRNLIILACTEVEAQLKGILKANDCPSLGKHYNTFDYVKLLPILKLNEYELMIRAYPNLGVAIPFQDWKASLSTASIEWYAAYNAIKHDREEQFSKGTLESGIDAIAACIILLYAQFGNWEHWDNSIKEFMHFDKVPNWKLEERYIPPPPDMEWSSANLEIK